MPGLKQQCRIPFPTKYKKAITFIQKKATWGCFLLIFSSLDYFEGIAIKSKCFHNNISSAL
jgi:hypothetical protein